MYFVHVSLPPLLSSSLSLSLFSFLFILYIVTGTFSTPSKLKDPSTQNLDCSPRVEICLSQKQPVDEFHPTVQELVEAGFSMEKCIEAVEHYETLEEAMDYLLSREGKGGIFQELLISERQHQHGAEMEDKSQQQRAM